MRPAPALPRVPAARPGGVAGPPAAAPGAADPLAAPPDSRFPLPSRRLARAEVRADPALRRTGVAARDRLGDLAFDLGERAALHLLGDEPSEEALRKLLSRTGGGVRHGTGGVAAGVVRFGDYSPRTGGITLFDDTTAEYARRNGLTPREAALVVLAHETLHHLDAAGLVELPQVEPRKRAPRWLRLRGARPRSLPEAAAHGFASRFLPADIQEQVTWLV